MSNNIRISFKLENCSGGKWEPPRPLATATTTKCMMNAEGQASPKGSAKWEKEDRGYRHLLG